MRELAREHTPLDEWESHPRRRILRAMVRRGWMTAIEILDVLGIECGSDNIRERVLAGIAGVPKSRDHKAQRGSLCRMINRLAAEGALEVRRSNNPNEYAYRISPSVPRSEIYYEVPQCSV